MSLLPFLTRNILDLLKKNGRGNMLKTRRGSILLRFPFFLYNVGCPPMMEQSAQRNAIP